MGRPLKIAKAQALLTVTNTTATTNVVTVSQNLSAPPTGVGIIAGMRFVPSITTGTNLIAGTTYWVLNVISANTFTVSATELSANPTSTPVTLTTGTTASVLSVGTTDTGFNNPDNSNTAAPAGSNASFGVVGGNTGIYGKQVLCGVAFGVNGTGTLVVESGNTTVVGTSTAFTTDLSSGSILTTTDGTTIGFVDTITDDGELELVSAATANYTDINFVYATSEAGYIVRQKGKTKYLVQGTVTGLLGQAFTANVANAALTPNTMSIIGTYAGPSTKYMKSVNDYQSEAFPATVAASSLTPGVLYTIYESGTTNWTAVGAASNITGITFTATATGSGTGTAVLNTVNPDVISTFGTAYAANTFGGQPNPIVTINNA